MPNELYRDFIDGKADEIVTALGGTITPAPANAELYRDFIRRKSDDIITALGGTITPAPSNAELYRDFLNRKFDDVINSIGGSGGSKIPCLCSTGAQSILLPVYGNEDLIFRFKLFRANTEQSTAIIAGGWGTWKFLFQTNENNTYLYYTGARSSVTIPAKIWEWQDVELGSGYAIVDGVTYTGGSRTRDADQISMFGIPSYYSNVAISAVKIYKNGNLFLDLIPMIDSVTGDGYYHDNISGTDYYSLTATPLIYNEL